MDIRHVRPGVHHLAAIEGAAAVPGQDVRPLLRRVDVSQKPASVATVANVATVVQGRNEGGKGDRRTTGPSRRAHPRRV